MSGPLTQADFARILGPLLRRAWDKAHGIQRPRIKAIRGRLR